MLPLAIYQILHAYYGPSGWWPGESPLEVMVGAVLTQNTAWTNVEKAIAVLKGRQALDLGVLDTLEPAELAQMLRSSGYYNIKAARLKNLIRTIVQASGNDLAGFFGQKPHSLRQALLAVSGIGKETADSICCYAADKPLFVVDAYTKRILARHGWLPETSGYDEVQAWFTRSLPLDLQLYKDLHAYLVFVGKEFCRPRNPACQACPLHGLNGKTP